MAEKDATVRLRRAVKENNLFLVKRLVQKTDQRNPDSAPRRYTSLAWAAVLGHEETFEFLLSNEHDDEELSRDSENNTILMLLAEHTAVTSSHVPRPEDNADTTGAALRMARLYFDRYSDIDILDWSNIHGKTALHIAALKGNEELARMLCDLGADFDLSDNKGNTPLHYASSWGHIPVVQLLIERGCLFAAKNNQGFTASDYAYSYSTMTTLQDSAWAQVENKKKSRRGVLAQAAARGSEWDPTAPATLPSASPSKTRDQRHPTSRMRSGSGTSRTTTATSDSGDSVALGASLSAASTPSLHSAGSTPVSHSHQPSHAPTTSQGLNVPANTKTPALSPVANRMRERDADAMEKYMRRNRSETSSDTKSSQSGTLFTSGPSMDGDDISSLNYSAGTSTPRRLRPSTSAAQLSLRSEQPSFPEVRSRSGTNPTHPPIGTSSPSVSNSILSNAEPFAPDSIHAGPSTQYAQYSQTPPLSPFSDSTPTASSGRRLPFRIRSKPSLDTLSSTAQHRRGLSISSREHGG